MANEVEIVIKGKDETSKAFDTAKKSSKDLGDSFDTLRDKSDGAEQKTLGLKDTIDGVSTIMQGPGQQGIGAYVQGWADLAGGMANFVIPALKTLSINLLKTAAQSVVAAGRQVVAWAVLSAKATIHAARIAAAWLISMGPIAIVVAAVIGLVVIMVKNWDKVKAVVAAGARFIRDRISDIAGFFRGLPGRIGNIGQKIWGGIKSGATNAINAVVGFINKIIDKINGLINAINRIPGVPNIPNIGHLGYIGDRSQPYSVTHLQHGGISGGLAMVGERGRELVRLPQGSQVIPNGTTENMLASGRAQTVVLEIKSSGTAVDNMLLELLRNAIRVRGGNPQVVLGQ